MARKPATAATSAEPGPEHRIVLLVGKETFLHIQYTDMLRDKLRTAHGAVDTARFDGAGATPAAVLDECRTLGLMQQHKLVIVDSADQFVKEDRRPILERYAQAPAPDATLVLRAEKWNKGKLDAMIEAAGVITRCESPTPDRAATWCVKRAEKRHGAVLEPAAAALLVERVGTGLSRLDTELAKLALNAAPAAAGAPVTITVQAVAEMVGRSREEDVWSIQSALLQRDAAVAVAAVRDALDISGHSPVLVSYACVDLARKLHGASRGMAAGVGGFDLIRTLKLWGASQDAVLAAAKRIAPDAAAALFREAVRADHLSKLGGDPDRLLERLALRFAAV